MNPTTPHSFTNAVAWQVGKWLSFLGSALALSVMTVISVGIGYAFRSVPDALKSSLPIGQYLGVSLMVYFGVKTLRARHPCPVYQLVSAIRMGNSWASR